jgi:hypothetical protein
MSVPTGWEKPAAEAAGTGGTTVSITSSSPAPAAPSPTSAKKVSWLSKVGAVLGKILHAAADVAKPVADLADPVLDALFPQFKKQIDAGDALVTKIAAEATAVEGIASAAGTQTGTGAQKLETVLQNVGPAIDAWVQANFPGAQALSTASKAGLVNAVVAILNEIDPSAAPPGADVSPAS